MDDIIQKLKERLDAMGFRELRMIALSKFRYCNSHPNHQIVFNSNIRFLWPGHFQDLKIHMCDINLTKEGVKLKKLANEFSCYVLVAYESDIDFMWPAAIIAPRVTGQRQRKPRSNRLVETKGGND